LKVVPALGRVQVILEPLIALQSLAIPLEVTTPQKVLEVKPAVPDPIVRRELTGTEAGVVTCSLIVPARSDLIVSVLSNDREKVPHDRVVFGL